VTKGVIEAQTIQFWCRNPRLGLAIKARACKGVAKSEARESHFMLLGVWESVKE
jgi:hypothetical protein